MRHCSRPRPVGMDRRAWPSFAQHEGDASDVEAALGTSHCLTGTALRDPATLNSRRRGTEDSLGRVAHTTQSAGPRSKAQPIDPVDVFGAASAAADQADKPPAWIKPSRLCSLPGHSEIEGTYSSEIPRCAHLTFEPTDGFGGLSDYYAIQFPTVTSIKLLTRHSGHWNAVVSLSSGASRMCPCLVWMILR